MSGRPSRERATAPIRTSLHSSLLHTEVLCQILLKSIIVVLFFFLSTSSHLPMLTYVLYVENIIHLMVKIEVRERRGSKKQVLESVRAISYGYNGGPQTFRPSAREKHCTTPVGTILIECSSFTLRIWTPYT